MSDSPAAEIASHRAESDRLANLPVMPEPTGAAVDTIPGRLREIGPLASRTITDDLHDRNIHCERSARPLRSLPGIADTPDSNGLNGGTALRTVDAIFDHARSRNSIATDPRSELATPRNIS